MGVSARYSERKCHVLTRGDGQTVFEHWAGAVWLVARISRGAVFARRSHDDIPTRAGSTFRSLDF